MIVYGCQCNIHSQATTTEKWLNMHQILSANGFDANSMKEKDRETLLQSLLEDNQKQFGHEPKSAPSASGNPLLTKYYWIEDLGVARSFQSSSSKVVSSAAEAKEKDVQQAIESGDMKLKMVKSENPKYEEFKQKISVLTTGKASLDKVHGQASDIFYQLKASSEIGCKTKADEIKKIVDKMGENLQEMREVIATSKSIDASDDKIADRIAKVQLLTDICMAHLDGFKVLKKKCLAMLG